MVSREFWFNQNGNVAVMFSLAAIPLVLGIGIAVDYSTSLNKNQTLQTLADAAAIGAAREMSLANTTTSQIETVAQQIVTLKSDSAGAVPTVNVTVDSVGASVEVSLQQNWMPKFMGLITGGQQTVNASATAQLAGTGKICVIGLEKTLNRTIQLKKSAQLTGNDCGVYSNSTNSDSIRVDANARITASMICSAGGATGAGPSFSPYASTDCPPVPDPLIDRAPPAVGLCDHSDFEATVPMTVTPGVYCGGLLVTDVDVTFEPGIYIIKDGSLQVAAMGSITGENVGVYFTGDAGLNFGPNSSVSLTAPKDGEMAGLLFYQDRNSTSAGSYRITSNDARVLLGTIYLSKSTLIIDANAPVGDQSAYTAIVARKLVLDAGPNLVLNSNYSATDIPIPGALSGVGGRIVLTQ